MALGVVVRVSHMLDGLYHLSHILGTEPGKDETLSAVTGVSHATNLYLASRRYRLTQDEGGPHISQEKRMANSGTIRHNFLQCPLLTSVPTAVGMIPEHKA